MACGTKEWSNKVIIWMCFTEPRNLYDLDVDYLMRVGGAVASWLVRSFPDRAVRVQALAGGHCVVFLSKTLNSHSASLHPGV